MADYLGRGFAAACCSPAAALQLALRALGAGPGDEVACPAFGAPAAAHAARLAGAAPRFADVHPDTFTLDPAGVEAVLSRDVKAIVATHLFGLSADLRPLAELARGAGAALVEDACDAFDANYHGRRVGSFGDLACFSLGPGSGFVTTDDPELSARLRALRGDGREIQEGRYAVTGPGLGVEMTALHAALCDARLNEVEARANERIRLAKAYARGLAEVEWARPQARPNGLRHAYEAYVIRVVGDVDRDKLIADLWAEGVEAAPGGMAPGREPFFQGAPACPVAERLAEETLALPLWSGMDEATPEAVCAALVRAAAEAR